MILIGYTATALSRNDIADTPTDKNVTDFAIVELKTIAGALVTIYDDALGTNPETQKTCDTNGKCTFFAEAGEYILEINGDPSYITISAIAETVGTTAGINTQQFINNFELKIFQSPTDNLTKVTTFAGGVGVDYEVRNTSDNSLAAIYSDKDGVTEIVQNGIVNVSDGDAEAVFYIASGDYTITINAVSAGFDVGVTAVDVSTSDGRSVQERLDDLPNEVDAAGTAATLIGEHNSDATAHPELSAFITSEADRAEVAADVAMTAGWVYADVVSGEAARFDGDYFWVVSSESDETLELWLMGVSSATDTGKRTPSTNLQQRVDSTTYSQQLSLNPERIFKGDADTSTATPASPSVNDSYFVVENGAIFGVDCERGQVIYYNGTSWALDDFTQQYRGGGDFVSGGDAYLATASRFVFNGYIDNSGAVIASGYKYTAYIPVAEGDAVRFAARGSASVAVVAYYDDSLNFISSIAGNDSNAEREVIVPIGVYYIRISNNPFLPTPYLLVETINKLSAFQAQQSLLKESDLTVVESSNLAKEEYKLLDQYVTSDGTIFSSSGWQSIKIPVTVGQSYALGRYTSGEPIYYNYFDSNMNALPNDGSFLNSDMPLTLVTPAGAAFLIFNIKRPTDDVSQTNELTVSEGTELLAYEPPVGTVTKIKDYRLAGEVNAQEYAKLGEDVNFSNVTAGSLTASTLIANLPEGTTEPAGLELNQAWIDTTDSTIKVRLV